MTTEPEIDDENLTLTDADMAKIREAAKLKVRAEKIKQLKAAYEAQVLEEIRGKAGDQTGDPDEDRIVSITINCAENADGIRLNGRRFDHGRTYEMPLHKARTIMDIAFRTHEHEHSISGKPLPDFYRRQMGTVVKGRNGVPFAVANAPARADGSTVL